MLRNRIINCIEVVKTTVREQMCSTAENRTHCCSGASPVTASGQSVAKRKPETFTQRHVGSTEDKTFTCVAIIQHVSRKTSQHHAVGLRLHS